MTGRSPCSFTGIADEILPTDDTIDLYRITDDLDPNILHDDTISAIPTANKTLWMALNTYGNALPIFWDELDSIASDCEDMNLAVPDAVGPFLKHAATAFEPTNEISTEEDFENLAKHPENVRIAINYDCLPYSAGAAWETFPSIAEWNALAPHDSVRNLKGREAAVAYREHGGEPYHYSVISYDERGRPEALLRYTENLGFDAVYYHYNSMNQVTSVTVADPFRQFTTWYGYDDNGRVDSVWTKLGAAGTGLGYIAPSYPATPLSRPDDAEITYVYTKTGQVDTMAYPTVSVIVDYHYSPRKWLDTLIATKGGIDLFKQELTFDAAGRITRQMSSHGGGSAYRQDYGYDAINQLTNWVKKPPGVQQTSENYAYDEVGNRESITYSGAGMSPPLPQLVYDLGRGSGPGVGPNQMLKSQDWVGTTAGDYTEYTYDPDGSMNSRKRYDATSTLLMEERFGYSSWRGLSWKYEREDPNIPVGPNIWEYRYRYNAMGEREQKREWLNPDGDGTAPGYGWTYYLLGGSKEQLSVWKGMQTSESGFCGDTGMGSEVYLYPTEYSSYAVEYNAKIEDILRLRTKPDGTIEYYITDHLASLRVKLDSTGQVLLANDYTPFGAVLSGQADRRMFTSREKDSEHDLYNNGVRKLDDGEGRFTSIDPLWEKFPQWSPYQYGYNNPMGVTDPSGMQGIPSLRPDAAWSSTGPDLGGGSASPVVSAIERATAVVKTAASSNKTAVASNTTSLSSAPATTSSSLESSTTEGPSTAQSEPLDGYNWDNAVREIVGGALVQAGQPTLPTRGKLGGATPGTSPASQILRERFPQKLPRPVRIPTGSIRTGIRMSTTTTLGAGLGRLVPWIGWGLLIWDAVDLGVDLIRGDASVKDGGLPPWMFPAACRTSMPVECEI